MTGEAERFVDGVVVEAPDAGAANASGLGLEIQDLTDEAALPEQAPVDPVAVLGQRSLEPRQHAEAEEPFAGDVLIAREAVGDPRHVGRQQEQSCTGRPPKPKGGGGSHRNSDRIAARSSGSAAGSRRNA